MVFNLVIDGFPNRRADYSWVLRRETYSSLEKSLYQFSRLRVLRVSHPVLDARDQRSSSADEQAVISRLQGD